MVKQLGKGAAYGERGFTLLEVLVVIAILGILALIIVPNLGWFSGYGQTEACELEDRMVKTAAIAYAAINKACPANMDDLAIYVGDTDDLMGSYSFEGTYPDCSVSQTSCP